MPATEFLDDVHAQARLYAVGPGTVAELDERADAIARRTLQEPEIALAIGFLVRLLFGMIRAEGVWRRSLTWPC